jgi:hypothetical protein
LIDTSSSYSLADLLLQSRSADSGEQLPFLSRLSALWILLGSVLLNSARMQPQM